LKTSGNVSAGSNRRVGETRGTKAGGRGQISRPTGLVEEVLSRIREDIISLWIPPDTRISVDNLVRELGVSQTPIREALSMLEAMGLVVKQHFAGYYTAPKLNRSEFEQLYEMRLLVEPYAARQAAVKMSDEALKELCELVGRMDPSQAAGSHESYERFAHEDSEFHAMIAEGSGNMLISEALARLYTHLHIFRLRFHEEVTNEAFNEHGRIIEALLARDPDAAELAMRSHIKRSYDRLARFTEE
jgi:DNA-binding GntR family transcriptional regulator